MSQEIPVYDDASDPLFQPIASTKDLISIFREAEKPRTAFRVGTEHERFVVFPDTEQPLPFKGRIGIESLLRALVVKSKNHPLLGTFEPQVIDGHLLALKAEKGASVTLEPGGQLELSGAPVRTIFETCAEIKAFSSLLEDIAGEMGIGYILKGHHPSARREDFEWVPKARYQIMRKHISKVEKRGIDMMLRTATIQANLDYCDEEDFISSFKSAVLLSPFVGALFANSDRVEGKKTGFQSERMRIWESVDPGRCGYPAEVFEPNFGYEKWVQYLLTVPMFFLRRRASSMAMHGMTFGEFLAKGAHGEVATIRDFYDHLTTVFTEVRAKPFIELRVADCADQPMLCALSAFWKGILYSPAAKTEVFSLFGETSQSEVVSAHSECARRGLEGEFRKEAISSWCRKLVKLSKMGLQEQAIDGQDESPFLQALEERVGD